ncbi:MAG: phenylalanine--tRNA ligase subunit alpha, partial [Ramlibacter sp.]|nr:phenylalanine--tRNA ligase subunit alpha [Ramlibacter sp.]
MSDIDQLTTELLAAVGAATTLDALEAIRVAALGKAGSVTALLKTLGGMSPDQRQIEGPRIQGLREAVTTAIATRKAALDRAELDARLASETLDMTLPAAAAPQGSVHPVSQVKDE